MASNQVFPGNRKKKPRVKVFKSDGQPVDGSLAKWVSTASAKPAAPEGKTGTEEFLRGVADLRQIIKQAITELDNLIEILEPLRGEEKVVTNSKEEKGQGINTKGLLELLQSPVVHNLLGSLLAGK